MWKPDRSGNPRGRSKLPIEELRAHARIYTADAVRTLVQALKHVERDRCPKLAPRRPILPGLWHLPGAGRGR